MSKKLVILLFLEIIPLATAESDVCPLWTTRQNNNSECTCGSRLEGILNCEDSKGVLALLSCYCMTTRDENSTEVVVSSCLFTCSFKSAPLTQKLHTNATDDLNNKTCGPYHRKGVMCGECIEGYGLPVYSYSLSCVKCSHYKYNWLKYIAVAYIPLTIFYFMVILFRISATSGVMIGYVTVCQMITIKGFISWVFLSTRKHNFGHSTAKVLTVVTSIWNLDFFRSIYQPFCLHPSLTTLDILLLDYLIALYPLLLILMTYWLVKLYDRFALTTWLCRPFYACFHRFRKECDLKASLIGAFATFYLLSYLKVINVTSDVLSAGIFLTMEGERSGLFFYYNASVPYFRGEHLPYAIFAVTIVTTFNLLPLLLFCLYPCHCFHRWLNKTGCRWQTLHVFMDAILGSYSCKPRERRLFGSIYLTVRILHVAGFAFLNPFAYLHAACYILIISIALITIFQPHKIKWHNTLDLISFSALFHMYLMVIFYQDGVASDPRSFGHLRHNIYIFGICVSLLVICSYGFVVLIKKTVSSTLLRFLCTKFKRSNSEDEESFPDHLYSQRRDLPIGGVTQYNSI